ncbi:MAG: hypothetical protein ACYTG7_08645 [Planctomycetota bacterium]
MKSLGAHRILVSVITVLFALAALIGLGDSVLWQDEAETALVAWATAQRGVPNVDLDLNILFEGGHHYNEDHVWTWQTWMPYYVGAASFLLFDKTAFAARLPFALLAILCIPLTAWLGRSLLRRKRVATLAASLLAANVPFLLFARQCRNYPLITCAVLLLLLAYAKFLRKEKYGGRLLAASLVLAFHSHLLIFAGVLVGLLLHFALFRLRSLKDLLSLAAPLAGAFCFTFPWYLYAGGFDRPGQLEAATFVPNLARFLVWINNYLFPLVLLVIPGAALIWNRKKPDAEQEAAGDEVLSVLIIVPLGAILAWCFCSQVFFRYLVVWIPVACVLVALCIHYLWTRYFPVGRAIGPAIVVLLVLTNFLSVPPVAFLAPPLADSFKKTSHRIDPTGHDVLSQQYLSASNALMRRKAYEHPFGKRGKNRCLWLEMIGELVQPVRGPMDAIVEHLNEKATIGDKVWAGYGDLPIMFHTDTRVVSWYKTALEPDSYKAADWILPRTFGQFYLLIDGERRLAAAGMFTTEFMPFLRKRFERMSLFAKETLWNNRPDPDSHYFQTQKGVPIVDVFRRKNRGD